MPEEAQELRRINWTECFGFTHIFRTFRLAIHPWKIVLALAGIVLTCLVGWLMDVIWVAAGQKAVPGEVAAYVASPTGDVTPWRDRQIAEGKAEVVQILLASRIEKSIEAATAAVDTDDEYWSKLGDLPDDLRKKFDEGIRAIRKETGKENLAKLVSDTLPLGVNAVPQDIAGDEDKLRDYAIRTLRDSYKGFLVRLDSLEPQGVFEAWLTHQRNALSQFLQAAAGLNLLGGMDDILGTRTAAAQSLGNPSGAGPGMIPTLALMWLGVKWGITQHWLFAFIFFVLFLAIWSLFGGAVCRMAAMQAARDEKIAARQALGFAARKFVGFFAAPLIPILLIVAVGFCMFIGGLVGSIPYVGQFLTGLLFFLALIGGFVMAVVAIALIAGGSLMWPTIAVEGSDSFDALSRSFSYIYSRPWRSLLYFVVISVYGALCFLFVRVFVFAMLKMARFFIGLGMLGSRPGVGDRADKLDAMWTGPTIDSLMPSWSRLGLEGGDIVGAVMIWVWVALTVAAAYAFLIAFYYSGSTIIYLLLRREVDATDMEDVYLDESEEEMEPLPEMPPMAQAPAASTETPPASPPSSSPPPPPPPPPPPAPSAG